MDTLEVDSLIDCVEERQVDDIGGEEFVVSCVDVDSDSRVDEGGG